MELSSLDANKYISLIASKKQAASRAHSGTNSPMMQKTNTSETGEIVVNNVRKPQKFMSEDDILNIIEEYKAGTNSNELAKKYGYTRQTIVYHLKKRGVRVTMVKNEIADNIPEIVALYADGMKISEIALQYNVGQSTIQKYLHLGGAKIRSRWDY